MTLRTIMMCMIGRHEPKRRYVEWDGTSYSGYCRHCGKPIKRVAHRKWQSMRA